MGLFDKLKQGLKKTAQLLNTDIRDLFKTEGRLVDEAFLDELFEMLVKTDMGVEAAQEIVDEIGAELPRPRRPDGRRARAHQADAQDAAGPAGRADPLRRQRPDGHHGRRRERLRQDDLDRQAGAPCSRREGKKVVLGAADTFRAAAVEQLTIWAQRLGAEIVTGPPGSDPASVAHRAVARAVEIGADVCIVDTAGRLQTQQNLMQQLTKIHRVLGKQIPEAPHEVLLVLDATTGQNGISQARHFTDAVRCTGIVLAKLDGTAKGGVVVAIRKQVGLPVKYVGVGEKAEDLTLFEPEPFVERAVRGLAG